MSTSKRASLFGGGEAPSHEGLAVRGTDDSGISITGTIKPMRSKRSVDLSKLTTAARENLPASAFVFPETRRYPIHDVNHARNALARSSGKPEAAVVRAAVYKRYPALRSNQ